MRKDPDFSPSARPPRPTTDTAFHAAAWTRQTNDVPDADLSFLPDRLRDDAIRTPNGEVMWHRQIAAEVIQVLAANDRVILGLDLRSDGAGTTPAGLATEISWSSFSAERYSGPERAEAARDAALAALKRPELAEMAGYDWVLITWSDA